jgi:hypothetical protein
LLGELAHRVEGEKEIILVLVDVQLGRPDTLDADLAPDIVGRLINHPRAFPGLQVLLV